MRYVLILSISGDTYSLKSTPNDWEHFMAVLFTFRVFGTNRLRGSRLRNIFRISFWCLTCGLNSGLTSNNPTHYLLHYGDKTNHTFGKTFTNLKIPRSLYMPSHEYKYLNFDLLLRHFKTLLWHLHAILLWKLLQHALRHTYLPLVKMTI